MKTRLVATLAILGIGASAAYAQTIIIEPRQEAIIRDYVIAQPPPAVDPGIDFDITVGSIVPDTVEIYDLDARDLNADYDYVVIDGRTVLVEPQSRKIIHIIE